MMDSERKRELIEKLQSFIETPPFRFDKSWNVIANQYIDAFRKGGDVNIPQIEMIFKIFLTSTPGIVDYRRIEGDSEETLWALLKKRTDFLPSLLKEGKAVDFALKRRNSKIHSFIDQAERLHKKPDHHKLKDLIDNIDKEFPEFLEAFSEQAQQKVNDARISSATSSPRSGTESSVSSTTTSPRSVTSSPRGIDPKEVKEVQDDLLKLRKVLLSLLLEEYQPQPDARKKEILYQSKLLKDLQEKASSLLKGMDLLFREEITPANIDKMKFLRDQIFVHFSDFILSSLQKQCETFCEEMSTPEKGKEESARILYNDLSDQIAIYVSQVTINDRNDDLVRMAMGLQKNISLAYEAMNNKFSAVSQSDAPPLATDHVVPMASVDLKGKFKKPNKAPPVAAPRSPQSSVKKGAGPTVFRAVPQEPVDPPLPTRVPPRLPGDSANIAGAQSPREQPSRRGPLPPKAPPIGAAKTAGAQSPREQPSRRGPLPAKAPPSRPGNSANIVEAKSAGKQPRGPLPTKAPSMPPKANQPAQAMLSFKDRMDEVKKQTQANEAKEQADRWVRLGGPGQDKRSRERLADAITTARDLKSIVKASADYILRSDHLDREEIGRDQTVLKEKVMEAVKKILGREDSELVDRLLNHVENEVLERRHDEVLQRRYGEVKSIATELLKSTDASHPQHSGLRFDSQRKPQHAQLVNAAVLYVSGSIDKEIALGEVKDVIEIAAGKGGNKERILTMIMKDIEAELSKQSEENRYNKK